MGFLPALGSIAGAILPSVLGFGAQVGTAYTAGNLTLRGQREANVANRDMAREQMAFQERMSSTAYQRAMTDMQTAGINPMLAASLGGASSPGGAMAQSQNELGPAVSSAIDAMRGFAELKNLREQNSKLKAETRLSDALRESALEEVKVKGATAKTIEAKLPGLNVEKQIDESTPGKVMRWFERFNPLSGILGPLIKSLSK